MTIDERLQALTHSVELLAQMHQDKERKYERRLAHIESLIERAVTVSETWTAIGADRRRWLNGLEG